MNMWKARVFWSMRNDVRPKTFTIPCTCIRGGKKKPVHVKWPDENKTCTCNELKQYHGDGTRYNYLQSVLSKNIFSIH